MSRDLLREPIGELIRGFWHALAAISWREIFLRPAGESTKRKGQPEELPALPPMVLYVDDDPLAVEAMKRRLRGESVVFVGLSDPEQAQEVLREIQFKLVILDVFMPTVSGVELLMDVRRLNADTPVLMLSGNPPEWLRGLPITSRDACLEKGCPDRELLRQIHRMLAA